MHPSRRGLECPKYTQLVPKKSSRSPVWNFYGMPADENGELTSNDVAICKLCKYPVSAKGGSTTNLLAHLKNYHPKEYASINSNTAKRVICEDISENVDADVATASGTNCIIANKMPPHKKQKTLLEFQPLTSTSEKQCTDAVTKFIAMAMEPFSIVECAPFVEMIKILNPRYKLPSRTYFSQNALPKLYNETKQKIKNELALISHKDISITTDCWTSANSIPYIAVTVHFVDNNWILKSACLCCVHFEMDHTAENICEILKEKLSDWDLNINQLGACTTDNGANILKAISNFDVQHVPCFGHTINIGINRALQIPVLKRAIVKVKKLQNSVSHSWKMTRDLLKAQELLQMKPVKLPSACPTRWGSTLKLCKRFLENQLPINKLLMDYPAKSHLMFESSEIKSLEDFVTATSLMEEVTKNLSGERYTTASSVLPLLKKIKKNLQGKDTDRSLVKDMKSEILSALEERYFHQCSKLMGTLRLATVCDPRFRLNYMEEKEDVKKFVLSHMLDIYNSSINMSNHNTINEKTEKCGLEKLLDTDSDDDDSNEEEVSNFPLSFKRAENELKNYLSMPKVSLKEDPLMWWKSHEASFPSLRVLAKKYLAIQGTSVPSERVFSTGGTVISKNRASLLPKNAEMQVFLTQNKSFI